MSAATVAVPGSQNAPYRAPPPGSNTDAFSHGLDAGPLITTLTNDIRSYAPFYHAAFLLENGCIAATDVEPSPSQPAFCVPAGLGSRFVSVIAYPIVGAVGGVTDAGFIIFTPTMTANAGLSTKCGYIAGPWTPQVTAVLLEVSRSPSAPLFSSRWSGSATAFLAAEGARWTLCGLTRAGDLECMRAVTGWWARSPAGGWKDFTSTGLGATTPAESACVDMTRNPLFFAPSPIFCISSILGANAAGTLNSLPQTCVSSHGPFVNFAVSTCSCLNSCSGTSSELGSVLTATRASDGVTLAYHAGWDGFDIAPVTAQARSIWNGSGLAPLAADPAFPVFRACSHNNWPYAGRLANGSYFLTAALADLGSSRAGFVTQANLAWSAWSAATNVRPRAFGFSVRPADSNRMCSDSTDNQELQSLKQDGATLPQWSAYSPFIISTSSSCTLRKGQFSALVRHDGTLQSGHIDINFMSDKPGITFNTIGGSARSDAICFAYTSPLPSPPVPNVTIGSFRSQLRCIGSQTLDLIRGARSILTRSGGNGANGMR